MPNHASGQPLPEWVQWDCCDQVHDDGAPCTGAAQSDYGRCLVHLDDAQLGEVMARRPGEAPPTLDARGARLTEDNLERVLAAAPRGDDHRVHLAAIDLLRALVTGLVHLGLLYPYGAQVERDVDLRWATIEGAVSLDQARVKGGVSLYKASVAGGVSLKEARVKDYVVLDDATIKDDVFLNQASVEGDVSLRGATIKGPVSLRGATIKGPVSLRGATIKGVVSLDRALIEGNVSLDGAVVEGDVSLDGATIKGPVSLRGATVGGDVSLDGATVEGDVSLDGATIKGGVLLRRATVEGAVSLREATVKGVVFLGEEHGMSLDGMTRAKAGTTRVKGGVFLGWTTVEGTVSLRGATVGGEALLGPMSQIGNLFITRTEFTGPVSLDLIAKRVALYGARFLGGLTARVAAAEVKMGRVEMQGHAVLADAPTDLPAPPPPRLLQLTGTDAARLTLTGVNLAACHFSGTTNLDELRIDGSPQLAERGGWWRAHRKVLAEEHVWRHVHGPARRRDEWYPADCRPHDSDEAEEIIQKAKAAAGSPGKRAQEIASVYRALRKGREDAKDEPGAADFYYGEMEMRRAAASGWERALLTLYWLLSGYALRASRSLAAFAVVVTVFAVVLYWWGFQPASAPDLGGAFVYSVESATVFFRGPGPELLTEWGRVFQVCLRLLGPALLALTVLAVRGRVKR